MVSWGAVDLAFDALIKKANANAIEVFDDDAYYFSCVENDVYIYYYNPDSESGGQIVCENFSYDGLAKALEEMADDNDPIKVSFEQDLCDYYLRDHM